jgi:hypothetical protein
MSQRLLVRVALSFFDRLDELLRPERTAEGTPSTTDFLLHEIPPIIDRLAQDYETATAAVPSLTASACSWPQVSLCRTFPCTRPWPPTARSSSSTSTSTNDPADKQPSQQAHARWRTGYLEDADPSLQADDVTPATGRPARSSGHKTTGPPDNRLPMRRVGGIPPTYRV